MGCPGGSTGGSPPCCSDGSMCVFFDMIWIHAHVKHEFSMVRGVFIWQTDILNCVYNCVWYINEWSCRWNLPDHTFVFTFIIYLMCLPVNRECQSSLFEVHVAVCLWIQCSLYWKMCVQTTNSFPYMKVPSKHTQSEYPTKATVSQTTDVSFSFQLCTVHVFIDKRKEKPISLSFKLSHAVRVNTHWWFREYLQIIMRLIKRVSIKQCLQTKF